jgi:hypothetical protein
MIGKQNLVTPRETEANDLRLESLQDESEGAVTEAEGVTQAAILDKLEKNYLN